MIEKLEGIEKTYIELEAELGSPDAFSDQEHYRKLTIKHAELGEVVEVYREFKTANLDLQENKQLALDSDPEIQELASLEIEAITSRIDELNLKLKELLTPKDPLDAKNIILEIRAGTGGDEAALFAADLFRMYSRYAEESGWKVELMDTNETGGGGFKEVVASVSGRQVYSRLKFESGTHRVQRVPSTESQGRIHTSAVTVAILPEAEEVDVEINPTELRIDVFRASGPGGQSVNTTDSAIRITHIPSGLVVSCQDEKSQHKNKAKAMKVLRARLLQRVQDQKQQEYNANRKAQVGSGDRSERIRTYNYPQGRVTDHRINLTLYSLDSILQGRLDEIIDPLVQHYLALAMRDETP